jgi:hypothetical protein
MDAQHNGELSRKGGVMNSFRAVADVAMTEALGPNTAAYSGSELQRALAKKPGIVYNAELDEVTGLGKVGLTTRKRGKMGERSWSVVKRKACVERPNPLLVLFLHC